MKSNTPANVHATISLPTTQKIPSTFRIVNVAFDVGSESLNWAMELRDRTLQGQCANSSVEITQTLKHILKQARQDGDVEIRVICESTGIYHRRLVQLADTLGMRTALVHGEAVAKLRSVQFGDPGKTDERDPKAALSVAKIGKLIKTRKFDKQYAQLRELHRLVRRCEARIKIAKCELHADMRSLFADLRLDKSVMYGPTGRALIDQFDGNPHRIVAAGEEAFFHQMKACSKNTKTATLKKIFQAAQQSVDGNQHESAVATADIQSSAVQRLYAEITDNTKHQKQLEQQMQAIYVELQKSDPKLPSARKGVVTLRMLSRLVAEIGPPDDFHSASQLMRYAGVNLCQRQSGKWKGRTMISRRGRAELRYVLNLMSIPLVGRKKLFGAYYWRKKETERMPGQKANMCVMRKILKMFYGWYKSGEGFDESRVFKSQSEHAQAA
ncbi:MAG: transposase [Planctomycetota bacterium]